MTPSRKNKPSIFRHWPMVPAVIILVLQLGCAHLVAINPGADTALYTPPCRGPGAALAPAFLVHNHADGFNRIGSPAARLDKHGREEIWIDADKPLIFYEKRCFDTSRGSYVNHIFRVHFVATPASLVPFLIGAGQNMGLLVIVTTTPDGAPLLVTTAGTCGCYAVSLPTNHLPKDMLPKGWRGMPVEIYGETFPALLDWRPGSRLVVEVRPGEHRVMNLWFSAGKTSGKPRRQRAVPTGLAPADDLTRLALNEKTTSLYYDSGWLAGHVKGAWKPWETLILGIPSLDMVVGMDKAYGDSRNPFYTSLKPWNRNASDLNDFPAFLKFNGWGL